MQGNGSKQISSTKRKRFDFLDKQFSGYKKAQKQEEKDQSTAAQKLGLSSKQDKRVNKTDYSSTNEAALYVSLPQKQDQNMKSVQESEILIDVMEKIMATGKNRKEPRFMIQERLIERFLNLDNTEQSFIQNKKQKQKSSRKKIHRNFKKTRLTRKQLKELEKKVSWEVASKLNNIWLQYISDLIGKNEQDKLLEKLQLAEIIGAKIQILSHKSYQCVGVIGIIIKSNQDKIHVVQQNNKIVVVDADSCWVKMFLQNSVVVETNLTTLIKQ